MVNKGSGTRKIWKWIAGIFIFLIVLLGGISVYFSIRWKPVLTEKIKDVVYTGSRHLYHLSFKDIHLNLLTGSVTVDSILLAPDTAVFHAWRKQGTAPTHLFQVKLEKLQLRRISILTIYFKKKIEMNDIILEHPSINMIYNNVYRKPSPVKDRRSLYDRISKTLKSVHIKGVKIEDADLDYISGATGRVLNSVKHLNVHVKDILIDSHSKTDTTRFYYTKDVSFEMTGYHSLSKNKMYTMKVDTITGSAAGRNIHIKGFRMIPMYPEIQFSKMLKEQKDRYDLAFDEIDFKGVNFYRLNIRGRLFAKSLRLKNVSAKVFMNREMPPGSGDKSKNFPHMALRRLPVPSTIDTLKLQHVNVAYTEYNPMSQEKGTIHIEKLNGNIYNVTNDSASIVRNHYAVADLSAYLVRAAQLNIRINFDLLAANAAFNFKGHIGKMNMTDLNPLAKSLGMLKVESGNVQKIDFDVKANKNGSRGTMQLYYNNLKIALLKEGESGTPTKKKGFLSFLANTLIVKDENPSKGKLRTADIVFERPPGASFFNLLWKSVFIGMRETVGLGIVPMKSPEEGRKAVVNKLRERQEKKESRKEKRQQRRAEKKAEKEQN